MSALLAFALVSGLPLGLQPGDMAYRCSVQRFLPAYEQLDSVWVAVDGDRWEFEPALAQLLGVTSATADLTGTEWQLMAPVSGDSGRIFQGSVVAAEDGSDRMALIWQVRSVGRDVGSEVIFSSGVADCHFVTAELAQDSPS